MLSCVCEDGMDDDCDLGICRSLKRAVRVVSPIIWAGSLRLIQLWVLIQKPLLIVGGVEFLLRSLAAESRSRGWVWKPQLVSSKVFCCLLFYSIRMTSFLSLFSSKCFMKPQLCRIALVTLQALPCPWAQLREEPALSVGGMGKGTLQARGGFVYGGIKKTGLSSQVCCLDQFIIAHLGQITWTLFLFRSEKVLFFLRKCLLTTACFLSSDTVGFVLENLTFHHFLLKVHGMQLSCCRLAVNIACLKTNTHFFKNGGKILAF